MEEMLLLAGSSSTQQISSTGSSLATDGVPRSRRQPRQHCSSADIHWHLLECS